GGRRAPPRRPRPPGAAGRAPPDPARRSPKPPPEGEIVRGIRDEPEVGERVLDLPPLVEPDTTHDLVGKPSRPEGILQHARLGVHPVEHGDAVERLTLGPELSHGPGDPERLFGFIPGPEEPRRLAARVLCPEALILPDLVVRAYRGGDLEDPARRAVVLLEAHDPTARKVPLEVQDVPEVGAPESVDGLVRIAHDAEIPVAFRELAQQPVLRGVRVLILVNQHVPPEAA